MHTHAYASKCAGSDRVTWDKSWRWQFLNLISSHNQWFLLQQRGIDCERFNWGRGCGKPGSGLSGGGSEPPPHGGEGGPLWGGHLLSIGTRAWGGSNIKLGGKAPTESNSMCALADIFMHKFTLYCLINIDVEQMINPMKRVALFLGFIKDSNVGDWVKRWATWTIQEFNME